MLSIILLGEVKMVFPNFAQNVFSLLDPASSYSIMGKAANIVGVALRKPGDDFYRSGRCCSHSKEKDAE
jgi:hypothetical protein